VLGPQWLTVGDLNGDGHLDIVASDPGDNTVSVLLGTEKHQPYNRPDLQQRYRGDYLH
jgi:hypothetical protein